MPVAAAMPVTMPITMDITEKWGASGVCRAYKIKYFIFSIGFYAWLFIFGLFAAAHIHLFFISLFPFSLIRQLLQGKIPEATPD